MDTLILLVVFTLSGLVARDAGRLGHAGWGLWRQLGTPPERIDARLVRGLTALYHIDGHAGRARAQGDGELAGLLEQAAHDSRATLVADLEDGLQRWRGLMPLLTLAWTAGPLSERGLRSALLRPWVLADELLELLPNTRCNVILALDGRMLVVRRALRRVRRRLARLDALAAGGGRDAAETLEQDQQELVRAGLECHEMLLKSLAVRREQLFGTRH